MNDPESGVGGIEERNGVRYILVAENLYKRLRNAYTEVHTYCACAECGQGIRAAYAVRGLCVECAEKLIERLEGRCHE